MYLRLSTACHNFSSLLRSCARSVSALYFVIEPAPDSCVTIVAAGVLRCPGQVRDTMVLASYFARSLLCCNLASRRSRFCRVASSV